MKLSEILQAVREQNLTKTQLESYHTTLSGLYGDLKVEEGTLLKEKALFFYERTNPETPDVKIRRAWDASPHGQRLIEVKAMIPTIKTQLNSLKSRLYLLY